MTPLPPLAVLFVLAAQHALGTAAGAVELGRERTATVHLLPILGLDNVITFDALLDSVEAVVGAACDLLPAGCTGEQVAGLQLAAQASVADLSNGVYEELAEQVRTSVALLDDAALHDQDWLVFADATCKEQVAARRREALQILEHGSLTSLERGCDPRTASAEQLQNLIGAGGCVLAQGCAAMGLPAEHLAAVDSTPDNWVTACDALFGVGAWEAAKSACLRATIGPVSPPITPELKAVADHLLATIAHMQGSTAAATALYLRVVHDGAHTPPARRLGCALKLLTLVPEVMPDTVRGIQVFREHLAWSMRRALELGISGLPVSGLGRLDDPAWDFGVPPFKLAHQGGADDRDLMKLRGQLLLVAAPELEYVAPHCRQGRNDAVLRRLERLQASPLAPVRLCFISAYMADHSIGRMMYGVVRALAADTPFEVHVASPLPPREHDPIASALVAGGVQWHVIGTGLFAARDAVAALELDVIVYPDLGMEVVTYYLAFARLAPVQCVWWGHPVTVGSPQLDYFVSLDAEPTVVPTGGAQQLEGADLYEEQLVRMALVNTAPFALTWDATAAAQQAAARRRGEPEALVNKYLVFGRLFKVHPTFDDALVALLHADPNGHILLIHEKAEERLTAALMQRLAPKLRAAGVAHRVAVIHHWNHPQALRTARAVLDTFPYGGCLTFLDAVAAGVPVVTLRSAQIRGRFSAALYHQMGITQLTADTPEQWVATAARLGTDDTFHAAAVAAIVDAFKRENSGLHRVEGVAQEWAQFLLRAHSLALRAQGLDSRQSL